MTKPTKQQKRKRKQQAKKKKLAKAICEANRGEKQRTMRAIEKLQKIFDVEDLNEEQYRAIYDQYLKLGSEQQKEYILDLDKKHGIGFDYFALINGILDDLEKTHPDKKGLFNHLDAMHDEPEDIVNELKLKGFESYANLIYPIIQAHHHLCDFDRIPGFAEPVI